jgi:hypothetical protein
MTTRKIAKATGWEAMKTVSTPPQIRPPAIHVRVRRPGRCGHRAP